MSRTDFPTAYELAYAFAAVDGDAAGFLRVTRKAFPRVRLMFVGGGTA